jgi:hypothetical protein
MSRSIPIALVQVEIGDCESKLAEILRALSTEVAKPMHQRDPVVLTFLAFERHKISCVLEVLSRLVDPSDSSGSD